ncbi:MAG: signal peptidase I [Candidatus Woesearchaeota archaeon]|jgi:signal peptidase I|nr:signal peptidase I [Candidatus Woesearchaeota archaeon]MDP7180204.1 signal peptidase I [Candidatus Woesearchaeota archaeon]MDP7458131.1 signal peptidase I [Candidatus Woesearchaeota archaeon]
MDYKQWLKKVWHFLWEEDSFASWIVNIIVAFILIKFIVYPGLGFLLGTSFPIVAVVSGSMEHQGGFDEWWSRQEATYSDFQITESDFKSYRFKNGFNTGDIMILTSGKQIGVGDVVVFWTSRPDPIIHRVVKIEENSFQTKGDRNIASNPDEKHINKDQVVGKAWLRIPWLGWVKIAFVRILQAMGVM